MTYFNRALFDGQLPNCLITLQRSKRSYGYFCGDRFGRTDGLVTDEIALNPRYFHVRPVEEVLSTLAHEMVHLWQHHYGKPGRGRYHNREWAQRMKAIGLHPSSTGKEGGQETGDSVGHFIVPGGPFEVAAHELLMTRLRDHLDREAAGSRRAPDRRSGRIRSGTDNAETTEKRQARQIHLPYLPAQCVGQGSRPVALRRRHDSDGTRAIKDAIKNAAPTGGRRRALLRSVALRLRATLPPCRCPPPRRG